MSSIKDIKRVEVQKAYWLVSERDIFFMPVRIVVREKQDELNTIYYQRFMNNDNNLTRYERKVAIISEYNFLLFKTKKAAYKRYLKIAEENLELAKCALTCAKDEYKREIENAD